MAIQHEAYQNELELPEIVALIEKDLSEPYSIFTYRYFIHNWPDLCIISRNERQETIAAIVGRVEERKNGTKRGYIAMLAVNKQYRKKGIGSTLAHRIIQKMIQKGCHEVRFKWSNKLNVVGGAGS